MSTSEDPLEKIRRDAARAGAAAASAGSSAEAAHEAQDVAEHAAHEAQASASAAAAAGGAGAGMGASPAGAARIPLVETEHDAPFSAEVPPGSPPGDAAVTTIHDEERTKEEKSEEFLLDAAAVEDSPEPYGTPGAPFKRSAPFYFGFLAAAGALVAWWVSGLIFSISSVLVLIIVALFLAIGLNPVVEALMRVGMKRPWAVTLVSLGVLAALVLFVIAIAPVITEQVGTLVNRAPDAFDKLRNNGRIERLDAQYDVISRLEKAIADGKFAQQAFGGVLGFGVALLSALANAFIVIVLTLYFLASLPTTKRAVYRLAPASRRERVTFLGDQILSNVGGYVSGAFLVALAAGLSSLIFLFAIGLGEYAVALAAVVAILDVIPMIGATLGAVVVTSIAAITDPKLGLFCLIFYLAYQQFENYVVYPRVMARSVNIPGSIIVIAALAGGALLGVVGALLAIPTAAAIQLLLNDVFVRRQDTR